MMHGALELAKRAAAAGDVPVGAVVVDADGQIIGRGYNTREADGDPLAHAEIIAMREAARALGSWNLSDCTLAVTLEPCPMCAGACVQTHIGTIVFGAWDSKLGACGSIWDIPRDPHIGQPLKCMAVWQKPIARLSSARSSLIGGKSLKYLLHPSNTRHQGNIFHFFYHHNQ